MKFKLADYLKKRRKKVNDEKDNDKLEQAVERDEKAEDGNVTEADPDETETDKNETE